MGKGNSTNSIYALECSKWYFGNECSTECTCDKDNTDTCDHITGACSCLKEWTEENCDTDVDECLNNKNLCDIKTNSTCNNTIGSYKCVCDTGFKDDGKNKCEECNMWHFGNNCSMDCACIKDNTDICNHVTGDCTCLKEWTGENCTVDVNECLTNSSLCDGKTNSTCNNTIGSYMCICKTGFQDIGYKECEECTGNTYGKNCSDMCGCNITNSLSENQACDIMTGQCKCKAGWYGDSCNDDVNECEDSRTCSTVSDTTCVNTFGSFLCYCLRGFTKSFDGACIKESLTTTAVPVKVVFR
ncbi:protein draper-like [Ruditapes philippinarum]|uniref:protein draper-like n=1 Tax=Ruditapes philippinarum TaxID=129788 RepID=UPI00295A746E|nr:protein draper-like [Ruditapes philippinarum]